MNICLLKKSKIRALAALALAFVLVCTYGQGCGDFKSAGLQPQSSSSDGKFICRASDSISANTVRRLPRVHLLNSLKEFLSRMNTNDLSIVMANAQAQLEQLPIDSMERFTTNDTILNQNHVDAIFEIAFELASILATNQGYVAQLASICGVDSSQSSLTGVCAKTFADYYIKKTFKRPVTELEVSSLLADPSSTTQAPLNLTSSDGLTIFLGRLMAHPKFYYIFNNEGLLISGSEGISGATYQLNKYELLVKLTFLYWQGPPNDYLYEKIESTDITQQEQMRTIVKYILDDPKAKMGINTFYTEWLKTPSLPLLGASGSTAYSEFSKGLNINVQGHKHRTDMIEEINDITEYYTFTPNGRYEDLIMTPFSFAKTSDLADLYGVSSLWDGNSEPTIRFPASEPRAGILTRAAFVANGTEYTNPIHKGKRIRFDILCGELPPPPANLDIKPAAQNTLNTTREIIEVATAGTPTSPNQCMSCHRFMNPLGFATENYDSLGRFRTLENKFDPLTGLLKTSLNVNTHTDAIVKSNEVKPVNDAIELSKAIVDSRVGQQCMVRKYFRYAFERTESNTNDGCTLDNMMINLDGSLKQFFESAAFQKPFLYRKVK
ncbi:MAG: DUF1588 domain-containing protein [Pseudomonadota bacterium]|nr:DUF1588 domain-containing protein [Pseudomonadota bacterium]